MVGHCRSGGVSSTSMTSKPSSKRPGASWRKRQRVSPKRLSFGFLGRLAPDRVQIGTSPLYGRRRLSTLNLKEPHYVRPLPAACFPGPQLYVKEHPTPALYLRFQLGLEGVPLAQKETIDFLLGGLRAWDSTEQVVDLASGPILWAVPLCFVLSHEKCLLA